MNEIKLNKLESYMLMEKYISSIDTLVNQMIFITNISMAMVQFVLTIKNKQQNKIDIA